MKTVIVTGVSRGLGLAIARRLVADGGYRLIGLSRAHTDEFRALEAEAPERARFIQCDVGDLDAIPGVVNAIAREEGRIWGLVNNAGIGLDGVLATMHLTDMERVMRVNLLAPMVFSKFVCRRMLAAKEGRIVNVSSIIATTGFSGLSAYAASKAGLEGFTRSLSREVGKMGVTVNCLAPGYMETEMTAGLEGGKLDSIRRRAPLGLPSPEDAAGAALYFLGPDGARVTGTVLTVDGGSTA